MKRNQNCLLGSRILVVCAHPDDEVFGLGGTLLLHSKNGSEIFVLIFSDGESSRNISKNIIEKRQNQAREACKKIGIKKLKFLNYPDQKLDTIPLVELSKQIETVIQEFRPDVVFTHHFGDVNQDHTKVFEATLIATRPIPSINISKVICFEIPSSSEWGSYDRKFNPNLFIDIENELNQKLNILNIYKNEIRKFPHPRSLKSIKSRAQVWGSQVGCKYAEAFFILREII